MTLAFRTHVAFVDGHVHIYECFDVAELFDSAYQNFHDEAHRQGQAACFFGILLLAETSNEHWFHNMRSLADRDEFNGSGLCGPWCLQRIPNDPYSLLAKRNTGESLLIIAGRQIVTAEGLEVLALVTDEGLEDGASVLDVVQRILRIDAIPVLPWGAGKWLGHRGKVLSDVLDSDAGREVLLGDNSGRPSFWRTSTHFQQALELERNILPGTDPLPIAKEERRVGNFGFTIRYQNGCRQPGVELRRLLRDSRVRVNPYGQLERPMRFMRNQLHIRLVAKRHLRKR